jgi:hypothetical protein
MFVQRQLGAAGLEMLAGATHRGGLEANVRDPSIWPRVMVNLRFFRWQPSDRDIQLSQPRSEHDNFDFDCQKFVTRAAWR